MVAVPCRVGELEGPGERWVGGVGVGVLQWSFPEDILKAGGHGVDVGRQPGFCWLRVQVCVWRVQVHTCACVYVHESSACMWLHIEMHVCAVCDCVLGLGEGMREPGNPHLVNLVL